jgi:hypothetical protein
MRVFTQSAYAFLILVLDEGVWLSSSSSHLNFQENTPVIYRMGGLAGPVRGIVTVVEKINYHCPCQCEVRIITLLRRKCAFIIKNDSGRTTCTCRTESVVLSAYYPHLQTWVFLKYGVLSFKESYGIYGEGGVYVYMSVHRKYISKVQLTRCNVFSICLFL